MLFFRSVKRSLNEEPATPLWRCPKCGHRFVTANLSPSCGRYSLRAHFAGKAAELKTTFDRFAEAARECGKVTVYAQKTRVVIQRRVRFASAVVRKNWIDAALWLKHRAEHPLLFRVEDLGSLGFYHHFRLEKPQDVDPALERLVRQAYHSAERLKEIRVQSGFRL